MVKFILAVYISTVQVTAYQPIPEQTDNDPHIMANGHLVSDGCLAVSRDLHTRWNGPLSFGDIVEVEGIGFYQVCDTMNKRHRKRVDILVFDIESEAQIWADFKYKKLKLYKLMENVR